MDADVLIPLGTVGQLSTNELKAKLEVLNNTQVLFENEGGALASYASKLRDAIVQQLAEKSARDRINILLGYSDNSDAAFSETIEPMQQPKCAPVATTPPPAREHAPTSASKASPRAYAVPLPSMLVATDAHTAPSSTGHDGEKFTHDSPIDKLLRPRSSENAVAKVSPQPSKHWSHQRPKPSATAAEWGKGFVISSGGSAPRRSRLPKKVEVEDSVAQARRIESDRQERRKQALARLTNRRIKRATEREQRQMKKHRGEVSSAIAEVEDENDGDEVAEAKASKQRSPPRPRMGDAPVVRSTEDALGMTVPPPETATSSEHDAVLDISSSESESVSGGDNSGIGSDLEEDESYWPQDGHNLADDEFQSEVREAAADNDGVSRIEHDAPSDSAQSEVRKEAATRDNSASSNGVGAVAQEMDEELEFEPCGTEMAPGSGRSSQWEEKRLLDMGTSYLASADSKAEQELLPPQIHLQPASPRPPPEPALLDDLGKSTCLDKTLPVLKQPSSPVRAQLSQKPSPDIRAASNSLEPPLQNALDVQAAQNDLSSLNPSAVEDTPTTVIAPSTSPQAQSTTVVLAANEGALDMPRKEVGVVSVAPSRASPQEAQAASDDSDDSDKVPNINKSSISAPLRPLSARTAPRTPRSQLEAQEHGRAEQKNDEGSSTQRSASLDVKQHQSQVPSRDAPAFKDAPLVQQASLTAQDRGILVYPVFAAIFSSYYERKSSSGGGGGGCRVGRAGYQSSEEASMEATWRLYAQWQQIMRDYATVFSGDPAMVTSDAASTSSEAANSLVYPGSAAALHYRVNASTRSEVYDIVSDALKDWPGNVFNNGGEEHEEEAWVELPNGLGLGTTWNLLWTWSRPGINYSSLLAWQKVNHFPGSRELTRKDYLKRNIARLQSLSASSKNREAFDIMPQTFILPHEYNKFVAAFYAHQSGQNDKADAKDKEPNLWILKPVGLSRGRGISLVSDLSDVKYDMQTVVQSYLRNPLLLDGFKWDMRLYVLVTSCDPLEAWIYREGFVRLSSRRFDLSSAKQSDNFVHLTNSSIQKHSAEPEHLSPDSKARASAKGGVFYKDEDNESLLGGSKRTLKWLWQTLADSKKVRHENCAFDKDVGLPSASELWASIQELVVKSLLCVDGAIAHQPNAFELFGYDVMLDDAYRPWLIEVNASPSMARDGELDRRVKDPLIRDTIALVDPVPFDRDALVQTIERRHTQVGPGAPSKSGHKRKSPQAELRRDLNSILKGRLPRQVGETPRFLGNYEPLAPGTEVYAKCAKLKAAVVR